MKQLASHRRIQQT